VTLPAGDPVRHGSRWIWSDGTSLPVVAGGEGPVDPPAPDPGGAAPASAGGTGTPPAQTPPAGPEPDYTGWTVEQALAEVHKTRAEAAAERVKAKEATEKAARYSRFDGLDPADFDVLGGFVDSYKAGLATGDTTAAFEYASQMAQSLTPAQRGEAAAAAGAAGTDAPMTRAEFNTAMAEREQALAQADIDRIAVAELNAPVRSPRYFAILERALLTAQANNADPDIRAAARELDAEAEQAQAALKAQAVKEYLDGKTAAAGAHGQPAPVGAGAGEPPGEVGGLKGAFARGRQRADDMLRNAQ